ncbi:MAG TPA: PfkB family carbohydrate kinase, partial [Roseiflexaceae bacterium]|nr:PfkB family carbohydrate kinase [Roseiflexaceae bacterium]
GAEGAVARRGSTTVRAAGPTVQVVDTTGAGDTFDAGFIYGFMNGWELERALQFACVCGALSTRAAGGTTAQPTLDEALEQLGSSS